ncbi:SART-1 family protein DOT2-like [Solanum tuberosum]|nr:PREDICTED: SART-1 family protein DOT2-like [Solanum tuberosum]
MGKEKMDGIDAVLFDDDDNEEFRKSYERVRKLSSEKQKGVAKTFPEVIASLISDSTLDNDNPISVSDESQVVFTEMGDFVWGLQFDKLEPSVDVLPKQKEELSVKEEKFEIKPDKTIREVPIGKGLSEALRFLRERGSLKEGDIELAGRNTDKKKNKLVSVRCGDEKVGKEIHINRTDEFGRNLTPKESFRLFSHQFHGKGPEKKKQQKRIRQHQKELKMKNPLLSVERMTKSQAQLKTPHLVLSGHIQPGLATADKGMLGDKKVGHFSGIKRKSDSGQYSRCHKFRNV